MGPMSRRRFLLSTGGVAGCWPALSLANTSSADPGLGSIAASRGLLYGSLVRGTSLKNDTTYSAALARECRLVVSALEMQWHNVSPTPISTDFSRGDAVYSWASDHEIKLRGHALVWHLQAPDWFADLPDRNAATRALRDHVHAMCSHFAGRIHSWDVINEAIQTNSRADSLRETVFLEKIGPDYLDIAFRAAREADGHALLSLNEFGVEYDDSDSRNRRRAMLAIIDGFRRRNTPIDVIGIQSHLATEYNAKLNDRSLADFLKEISDRGLKIMITELDVVDRASPSDIPSRDGEVAALYKRYLDVTLDNRAVIGVVTWGLTDKDSWITRGDLANFHRADGLPARPLPLDDHYRRKPAYDAVAEAFRTAPLR
jgi:endo-1,4-beta-xylanase